MDGGVGGRKVWEWYFIIVFYSSGKSLQDESMPQHG